MPAGRFFALFLLLSVSACSGTPDDPRAQILTLITRAEQAAEAGDAATLRDMLHPDFRDHDGRDRRATGFMLRSLLGRYAGLEIVTREVEIDVLSPRLANARLTLTLVARHDGRPVLAGIDADRRRLDLALRADGDVWRVTRADWSNGPAD